jgi:hypothetical protein
MKLAGYFAGGTISRAVDAARAVLDLAVANGFEVDHVSFEFNGRYIYVWLEDTREQTLARAMGELQR